MAPRIQTKIIKTDDGKFALVDGNDEIIRSGFRSKALCAMWGKRKSLYEGKPPKHRSIPIPEALMDERVFGIRFYAQLQSRNYQSFLVEARRGDWGTLLKLNGRDFGIRWGEYRQAVAAREVKTAE
jgi:hypothetical protein